SQHTLQLINNILDYSKLEAGKSALDEVRFNLKTLVSRLQSIFEVTARLKKIELVTEIKGSADIFLKGDYTKLSQVLINLLSNAVKFTEKGYIKLQVHIHDKPESDLAQVGFCVADTGIGIPEKSMHLIFESFSQADVDITRRFGGTGLGLTISEKILNLMNAKLQVNSKEGRGSEFSFEVKLKKSSPGDQSVQPQQPENKQLEPIPGVKILLAEDNIINQRVAGRIMEKWGATVVVAANGAEAVAHFDSGSFDMVLMDLDMPIMDGYEATSVIRGKSSRVPIIALTAAIFDNMEEYLVKKGFTGVVQKPFMPRELHQTIKKNCDKTKPLAI
ncbi:MAG: response regulator, partial [Dinghuibacter sp.]|nr:response regulator [Dinghuibacter sp.]